VLYTIRFIPNKLITFCVSRNYFDFIMEGFKRKKKRGSFIQQLIFYLYNKGFCILGLFSILWCTFAPTPRGALLTLPPYFSWCTFAPTPYPHGVKIHLEKINIKKVVLIPRTIRTTLPPAHLSNYALQVLIIIFRKLQHI
jgi:hypothetical protein